MTFQTPTWFPRAEDAKSILPWNQLTPTQRQAKQRAERYKQLQELSSWAAEEQRRNAAFNREQLRQDLPLANEAADSAAARANTAANQELDRQMALNSATAGNVQDSIRTGGQVAGGVLTTASTNRIREGEAGAQTFVNTVLPGMERLIGAEGERQQWAMNKLIGEGSLLPQLTDLERHKIDQQAALVREQMPPKWAQTIDPLIRVGALIGAFVS